MNDASSCVTGSLSFWACDATATLILCSCTGGAPVWRKQKCNLCSPSRPLSTSSPLCSNTLYKPLKQQRSCLPKPLSTSRSPLPPPRRPRRRRRRASATTCEQLEPARSGCGRVRLCANSLPSLTKYTTAGQALGEVLKKLVPKLVAGEKVLELSIAYVPAMPQCGCGSATDITVVTSSSLRPSLLSGTRPRTVSRSPRVCTMIEERSRLEAD